MSKISDYIEKVRKIEEDLKVQTVATFAEELRKTPDDLLKQLTLSEINKSSIFESVSDSDKQKLLSFLEKPNSLDTERKKITINKNYETELERLLNAIVEKENGAEMACLNYFADEVVWGHKIPTNLQEVINLILAKAVKAGSLPEFKLGRPKNEELDDLGRNAANQYWNLRDSGVSYADAVKQVALEIHKDERHVMRLIAKHKKDVGLTIEERKNKSRWNSLMWEMSDKLVSNLTLITSFSPDIPTPPDLETSDYLEHLDEQISKIIRAGNH